MVKRLTQQYAPGTIVQITFGDNVWHSGVVIYHQPPGVWVRTADGRSWFVTNTRHIRPMIDES